MKKIKKKKYRLCVYLLKKNCSRSDVIKNPLGLIKYSLKNYNTDEMMLYVKKTIPYVPRWLKFFDGYLEKDITDLYNSSSAAILIVESDGRYFAFTFGYGRSLLNLNNVEDSFGLKVTLNSIDPDKIKSVDIKNLDTVLRYSRVQTSTVSAVDNFGMNVERDILNAVTGKSTDNTMGDQISGSVALHIGMYTNIDNLKKLCKKLLGKFYDKSYKKMFSWVDHINEVKNRNLIDELDGHLIKSIRSKDINFERLYLAIPELIDWEQFAGFRFKEKDELREDIFISDVLRLYKKNEEEVTLDWLRRREVLCIGKDNEQIINNWTLYKCINFEFKKDEATYLLHGSKWFKIDTNYVRSVNRLLKRIDEYTKFTFPIYEEEGEGKYNRRVSKMYSNKCILMDKKNILYGGGRSRIEFCDLIINQKDFIHVKRFRGSSALSHLFFQGLNSATVFLQDTEFVRRLNKRVSPIIVFPSVDSIKASDYEIVFAIISKISGDIKELLPFFSKVSFLQIYRQLKAYGFRVSVAKISIQNTSGN